MKPNAHTERVQVFLRAKTVKCPPPTYKLRLINPFFSCLPLATFIFSCLSCYIEDNGDRAKLHKRILSG